jgi:hypothetical protein
MLLTIISFSPAISFKTNQLKTFVKEQMIGSKLSSNAIVLS